MADKQHEQRRPSKRGASSGRIEGREAKKTRGLPTKNIALYRGHLQTGEGAGFYKAKRRGRDGRKPGFSLAGEASLCGCRKQHFQLPMSRSRRKPGCAFLGRREPHFIASRKPHSIVSRKPHFRWPRKPHFRWSWGSRIFIYPGSRIFVGLRSRISIASRKPHFPWPRKLGSRISVGRGSRISIGLGSRISVGLGSRISVCLRSRISVGLGTRKRHFRWSALETSPPASPVPPASPPPPPLPPASPAR
jgi:hypothetical protein